MCYRIAAGVLGTEPNTAFIFPRPDSSVMPKSGISAHVEKLERVLNVNFSEIQRRLEELLKFQDRTKENFLEVEHRLIEFDQKIEHASAKTVESPSTDIEAVKSHFEEKLKALEDVVMLLELEVVKAKSAVVQPDLAVTPHVPSEFEDRLKTLEHKFSTLEKLKFNAPVEMMHHEPRLKSMEANIFAVQKAMREEVDKLENMINDRVPTEQGTERFITKMREEMDELRNDIGKAELLKNEIVARERAFATRPELEDFETRIKTDIVKIHALTDRVSAAEKSLDSQLINIEDRIESAIKQFKREAEAHMKSMDRKTIDLETSIKEELENHRRNYDSKLIDMEESVAKVAAETATVEAKRDVNAALAMHRKDVDDALKSVQDELSRIKPLLSSEKAASLMQRVNTIECDLESRATAVVIKEIAAFSEAIDKKFPDLVTKADFTEWSHAVAERVRSIETPDISPLVTRLDDLEIRVGEFSTLIREVVSRMPLVIE